jgi:plastocyanin
MTLHSRRSLLAAGLVLATGGMATHSLASSSLAIPSPEASPEASPIASPQAAVLSIMIENYKFAPQMPEIPAGTTVTWTNKDIIPHTVAATDGRFMSPTIGRGDSFSVTFDQPGVYPYLCTFHTSMKGQITVK